MAKSLKEMSPEALRITVMFLTISQIKSMIERIYEFKKEKYGYLMAEDLERKETILKAEFVRRNYFMPKKNPQDNVDFNNWQKRLAKIKRFF
jgi:hypothetical protein